MTEVLLERTHALTQDQIGRAWIQSLSVRAGTAPMEALDDVPIDARIVSVEEEGNRANTCLVQRIGGMTVTLNVVHEPGRRQTPEAVLDTWSVGPMTELFRSTEHLTAIEHLSVEDATLICRHRVVPQAPKGEGLESAYWPMATLVDCMVLAGQMAQVLIYQTDQVDRDATNTIWMRRVSFSATSPAERTESTTAKMAIAERRTMTRQDRTINSIRVSSPSLFGFSVEASLAYVDFTTGPGCGPRNVLRT